MQSGWAMLGASKGAYELTAEFANVSFLLPLWVPLRSFPYPSDPSICLAPLDDDRWAPLNLMPSVGAAKHFTVPSLAARSAFTRIYKEFSPCA